MIKNIFFSGGGLKGWAYVGSIRALEEVKELIDLRESIEADYYSENLELLSSLVESGRELINYLTKKVHDKAKKEM
jgi:hypothetical protein